MCFFFGWNRKINEITPPTVERKVVTVLLTKNPYVSSVTPWQVCGVSFERFPRHGMVYQLKLRPFFHFPATIFSRPDYTTLLHVSSNYHRNPILTQKE